MTVTFVKGAWPVLVTRYVQFTADPAAMYGPGAVFASNPFVDLTMLIDTSVLVIVHVQSSFGRTGRFMLVPADGPTVPPPTFTQVMELL